MSEKQYPPEPERTKPAFYAALYPALLETAQQHGYTLACHGSMMRDFDLVAVPWTEKARAAEDLIRAIVLIHAADETAFPLNAERALASVSEKPHGRRAYTVLLGGGGPRLDISVMPRVVNAG